MGAKSRTKGRAAEQELVKLAKSYGLTAERTWQNASSNDPLIRNVDVVIAGRKCQSKRVRKLPQFLRELLPEGCDMGFVREDDGEWLVVGKATQILEWMRYLEEHNDLPTT